VPDLPTDADIAGTYQDALRAVRLRMGTLDVELGRALAAALRRWADNLEARVADMAEVRRAAALDAAAITRETAATLERELVTAAEQARALAYTDVQRIWEDAIREAVGDAPGAEALLGTVRVPSITMLNQYASLNAANHWVTLLRSDVVDAAAEANRIILDGIAAGISPPELASRLRRYVDGADTFAALFHDVETPEGVMAKLDRRTIPRALQGAAAQVDFNARRIAHTELWNARAEAEVQHFVNDPLVAAVQWRLSPDRGTQILPDECDILARADFYGLGPGVYPVDAVPAPPHPFDRCERMPVTRGWSAKDDPKPAGDLNEQAWKQTSRALGKGMSKEAWLSTVQDALSAVFRGSTLIP